MHFAQIGAATHQTETRFRWAVAEPTSPYQSIWQITQSPAQPGQFRFIPDLSIHLVFDLSGLLDVEPFLIYTGMDYVDLDLPAGVELLGMQFAVWEALRLRQETLNEAATYDCLLTSIVIWLVPFVASIPFFNRSGALTIDFWVFKALMAALLLTTSFFAFGWLYRRAGADKPSWRFHLFTGLGALAISVLLDAVTIIPLTGITPTDYVQQVVSIYLLIPIIAVYVGSRQARLEATV